VLQEVALKRILCREMRHGRRIEYDSGDYAALIEQYRTLSKKGSRKAISGIKEVFKLKKELLSQVPEI
jgi:hypothetical protein